MRIGIAPRFNIEGFPRSNRLTTRPITRCPNGECGKPGPLEIDNPGNPMSWMEGITKLQSAAQNWAACIQNKLTESIYGDPSIDPVMQRHFLFQAAALIGKMYDLEKYAKEMQKQNKEAEKDTFDLALAARSSRA